MIDPNVKDLKDDPALDAELAEFQSGATVAKRIAQAREDAPWLNTDGVEDVEEP